MSKRLLRAFGLRPKSKTAINLLDTSPIFNGLLNLPSELWLEIFAHAAALSVPTRSISPELQNTQSTYHALSYDEGALSDTYGSLEKFAICRNIILVCKAWYQLGISTLYSHINVDTGHDLKKLKSLYKSVQRHSSLASSVIRLSVTDSWGYVYNKKRDRSRDQILAALFPLLTNVRIFASPSFLIRDFYSALRPDVVIMDYDSILSQRIIDETLTPALQFASQAHTLSFTHTVNYTVCFGANRNPITSFPALKFPNLINLHVHFEQGKLDEFVVGSWTLPHLRTLSITSDITSYWMDLIRRHAENLEALEVTPSSGWVPVSSSQVEKIRLPKLTKLCIYISIFAHQQELTSANIKAFAAPQLVQLCYRIHCISDWFYGAKLFPANSIHDRYYLKVLGEKAREIWPTMRELSFSYWREWSHDQRETRPNPREAMERKERMNLEDSEEAVSRFQVVDPRDTELNRLESLQWLAKELVEEGVTVIFKRRRVTELVFPSKSEGGMDAMMEYRTPIWPPAPPSFHRASR